MPNLAQMYANCDSASYYSRSQGEIWAKLNEAGFEVFSDVKKEMSGYFLKFDESSLTLTPGQANQEYTLPADVDQIAHLAERVTTNENWHPMAVSDGLETVLINQLTDLGLWNFASYGFASAFSYYGPFLDAAAAVQPQAGQIQKIRVSPITDQNRFVQLVYTARWIPIVNANSQLMMPDEGTYAMEKKATAKLLRLNNDSLADSMDAEAVPMFNRFLNWLRSRQIQSRPTIQPFTCW